ncbi:uncharacterized protein LOC113283562 isoform X2 [Papaver somniferum]|uniref:uncharacterized protein LOC113283562 isoform X2 n=1 Tax=Papaver somniferum TaxID=3469 RepID=UPI000E6FBC64|nr:uncharacterized protein LOC113283562 isoform X2 [Papaver somniferum]
MSFSSSVNLQFAVLTEFLSSHKPPWLTVVTIPIGFCLINILVNLWISYIINPNKNQAIDERTELEAQVRKIRWNEDGWSKKMIEKKEQKIAALEKKIDRLQNCVASASTSSRLCALLPRILTSLHQHNIRCATLLLQRRGSSLH